MNFVRFKNCIMIRHLSISGFRSCCVIDPQINGIIITRQLHGNIHCIELCEERFNFHLKPIKNCKMVSNLKTSSGMILPLFVGTTVRTMAGHSKWANIKHTKALKDQQKALVIEKYTRMIRLAVREGGSADPKLNGHLAQVIDEAKSNNVPMSTVQGVLKASQTSKEDLKQIIYSVKGPGGSIVLVDIVSSNLHVTKQNMSTILRKSNCSITDGGSKHLFEHKGIILARSSSEGNFEDAMDHAIDVGAEDVKAIEDDESTIYQFSCTPFQFSSIKSQLEALKYEVLPGSGVEFVPHTRVTLNDLDVLKVHKLCEALDKLPEVVAVYDNVE